MDRVSRLNLLFGDDESLLKTNTGLHTDQVPVPDTEQAAEAAERQTAMEPAPGKPESASYSKQSSDEKCADTPASKETVHSTPTEAVAKETSSPVPVAAKLVGSFCPVVAVSWYPYKYIRGEFSQTVAHQFFDEGKFWNRVWDLYYVPVPDQIASRPLLLVPASQVQQLLCDINASLNSTLSLLTNGSPGLLLPFQDDGTPQPLYLGQTSSKQTKAYLESKIRALHMNLSDYAADEEDMIAFEKKIQAGVDETKSKRKATKVERQQERYHAQVGYERCVTRVQCYFGLLDAETAIDESLESIGQEKAADGLPALDLEAAASFPAWKEPVLISVDVELNENSHSQVTEIGVSVLDTLDLVGVAPGENGTAWTSRIQSRHFRVLEYANVVNSNFISGCPDRFEFGQSEWVALDDLVKVVEDCFRIPSLEAEGSRNIILVGHGIACDVKYLRNLGVTLFDKIETSPKIIERIDTAQLFRVWKQEQQPRGLGKMLSELDIVGWNLHNAGNDARYTLEAVVCMAVQARQTEKRRKTGMEVELCVDSDKDKDTSVSWL